MTRRKRYSFAAIVLLLAAFAAGSLVSRSRRARPQALTVTFVGYVTNQPGIRMAQIRVSNETRDAIYCYPDCVIESQATRAVLPVSRHDLWLQPDEGRLFETPPPTVAGPWRFGLPADHSTWKTRVKVRVMAWIPNRLIPASWQEEAIRYAWSDWVTD